MQLMGNFADRKSPKPTQVVDNQPFMKKELTNLLAKIDDLKREIEAMRPLPPEREGRIFQKLRLDWNFHSNAIEGNSLTYGETNAFLMEGLTAKGKPLKDHLDLKGHNEAIDFLRHFIDKNEEITERDVRELHKMILVEPYKSKAISPGGQPSEKTIQIGQYKTQPNHVQTATGEMFYFASPEETPARMHDLMVWYRANRSTLHPVELAALFHYDFVRIHPFDDGNGRMSRLLMNFILMQFGFPPIVIKASKDKKAEYFYALQMADKGGKDVFVEYIGEQLVHSMEVYLRGARGEDISEVDDLDKEIELLKKSFGEDKIKEKRDVASIQLFIKNSVYPLLSHLNEKCNQLDSLFLVPNYEVFFQINSQIFYLNPLSEIMSLEETKFYDMLTKLSEGIDVAIKYQVQWKGFKKTSTAFNSYLYLNIYLKEFDVLIESPNRFSIIKIYDNIIEEFEKHSIINQLLKPIIEEIKQKTQKQ